MLVCILKEFQIEVIGYVDSDYTEDLDKRRSHIGNVFTIEGCAIS